MRWEEFQHLDRMKDHWWWRPGWRVGRRFYTWHLTFGDSPQIAGLAIRYQNAISLDFLDPVPLEWLHLTMQGIGFADEVSRRDLDAVVTAARDECAPLRPFDILVGPAYADAEGVPLAIEPWEPIEDVRAAIRRAIARVWGFEHVPEPEEGFTPHITLFYSNSQADPAPLHRALVTLPSTPPVRATVRAASLIELGRDEHVYRWSTIAEVPLGSG
jgi:2'-5' RNA ligase